MGYLADPPAVLTATADFPELCIEWLPTRGPGAADGDWCDITAHVTEGKISRGRQYELDRFQAGTLSLTLKSTTRLFDPEYTAGPFHPYLIPMRQIRVSAVWAGVRYPIGRGYITDWGDTVPDDAMFVTDIAAKDAFLVLEQIELPSSAWAFEVVKDDPSMWLRLGETDTVRVTDSSAGGNYGLYDNCQQGVEGLIPNDSDAAVGFVADRDQRVRIQSPTLITAYPFTISAVVQTSAGSESKSIFEGYSSYGGINVAYLQFYVRSTGTVAVAVSDGTNIRIVASTTIVDDGLPHHVVVTLADATTWSVYIDGVAATTTTSTGVQGAPAWAISTGVGYFIGNSGDFAGYDSTFGDDADHPGVIDEVCVWNGTAVSSARIAALALAAKTGWAGDDTGARSERFLDALDWPDTLRDIETGISILGPANWSAGTSALSVMQAWADTELGAFLIGKSGEIVWRSRHHSFLVTEATTSQATFGDAHSAATLKYRSDGFELPRDEALIRNPVQAGRQGGVTVVVKDQALIDDKYGNRSWAAPNSQDRDDASIRDRAMWLLARYKEPGSRLARMELAPRSDPANLWPEVLGREIGERITVERTPLGGGNQIVVDQIIERVEHAFSPKSWTTTFRGSPVDPGVGSYLILDDATYGELDAFQMAY